VLREARGDVLIAGLGIGMILVPILSKPEVNRVLVIEKYQDVIDLVGSHVAHSKLTIECADILEYKPAKGSKWNTIYFDIWPDICTDNLDEIATLKQRFKYHKAVDGWMGAWVEGELRGRRRSERGRGW
jgi:spermidine synthase